MKRILSTLLLGIAISAPATADVRHRSVYVAGVFSTVCPLAYSVRKCAASLRNANYLFGVVIKPAGGYTIDKIWMRVRRSDGSHDGDLAIHYDDVGEDNFALFQFHAVDVAVKLDITPEQLQIDGFQIRPKIKSLGGGSGLQDKCPVILIRYDTGTNKWAWKKKSDTSHGVLPIGIKSVLLFKSAGTINNVICKFDGAYADK